MASAQPELALGKPRTAAAMTTAPELREVGETQGLPAAGRARCPGCPPFWTTELGQRQPSRDGGEPLTL